MATTHRKMMAADAQQMEITARYLHQNAKAAIQDVYDALIELLTNADDRYVWLAENGQAKTGRIEIEVERRRKGLPSVICVRDFADGMTLEVMKDKLCQLGKRVSGMSEGSWVRGTNSRGAKDVAVLGGVVFESIAGDGRYHKCEITSRLEFIPYEPSQLVTANVRRRLGILKDTGTLVTAGVDGAYKVPQHNHLRRYLGSLVALREMLCSRDRCVTLLDINQERTDQIAGPQLDGKERIKERFSIPGYPDAEAKLVVKRAAKRFEDRRSKYRHGGILIKSRHAVHESTYFATELETDPHAAWFFGKLTCEYIDDLWNEYDERFEKGLCACADNPCPIVDPQRKLGLRREHPFTQALFRECLRRFRPLVEEERKQQEAQRGRVESEETRKRLSVLERAAAKFMERHLTESEVAREPDDRKTDSVFERQGYSFSPPFAQIVSGHSCHFWLNIWQESFPELSAGDAVEISCLSDDISSSKRRALLEPHPTQDGIIRSVWLVRGERPTPATGIQVRVGPIVAERVIEVLASEKDKYKHIVELCFNHKRYSIVVGSRKTIQVFAPYPSVVERPTGVEITCSDAAFSVTGSRILRPRPEWGVAICKLLVNAMAPDRRATLYAGLDGHVATAELSSAMHVGAPIKIEIVADRDPGNQRSRWSANSLRVFAKHPSVQRYLGPGPEFTNQEQKHFRVLLAEIVAEAVCQRVLGKKALDDPDEYKELDWDGYYADYTKLMTEFLPIAHESQVKDP